MKGEKSMQQNPTATEPTTSPDPGALFPIRTVATLTGVNPVTLRAWERRYGLIRPTRTPKGHRLYSQEEIDLIQRILELLEQGIPIGQVKRRLETAGEAAGTGREEGPWERFRRRMIEAVTRFDEGALERAYHEALSLYPVELVTRRLILPLLRELGERWEKAEGSVAEEHFFGTYLRNKLGARFHHQVRNNRGPKIVAACLPGEHHEVGLLLFCLLAIEKGYRIVLLGADLPFEELPAVVTRTGARAVVLSGSIDPPAELLREQLARLTGELPVPVLIGGRTAISHREEISAAGAHAVGVDPGQGLRQLARLLPPES
ncbi:MAG: MerR family transcriptional regulator [Gammaproteobacteria bacterium]